MLLLFLLPSLFQNHLPETLRKLPLIFPVLLFIVRTGIAQRGRSLLQIAAYRTTLLWIFQTVVAVLPAKVIESMKSIPIHNQLLSLTTYPCMSALGPSQGLAL